MVWSSLFGSLRRSRDTFVQRGKSSTAGIRKHAPTRRHPRLETMERRKLLATDLASITGQVFINLADDIGSAGDPPVLVDNTGAVVNPGDPGAQGVTVELFRDNGDTAGAFDSNDTLVGTDTTDPTTGIYRFDGLTVDTYFVRQQNVTGLNVPSFAAPELVQVTQADGEQTVLIDDFSDTTEVSFDATPATPVESEFQSNLTGTVGGQRDVQLTNTNNTGQFSIFLGQNSGQVSVGSNGGATGTALIQYDGPDGAMTLDATGLNGASLGGGAATDPLATGGGLILNANTQLDGDELFIQVFSDAANSSTATVPLTQTTNFEEIFVPFSSFTTTTGTGANFNSVGAIEATVEIDVANNDVDVQIIEARRTDVFTRDLPNIQPLSLGGILFEDVSTTGGNNGIRENTEPAFVDAVTVELYDVTGLTGAFDPAQATPVATTTTTATGNYLFSDLDPGDYRVVIPASQFVDNTGNANPNGVLFGYSSSLFDAAAPDPNNDVDDDDNGQALATGAIITGPITLVSQSEPVDDDDTDPNTNTTLDFGLIPQVDLQITKTLRANSNIVPGGQAIFRLTLQNLGPLDATGVTVTDTLPNGLAFVELQNNGSLTAVPAGSDVNINVGNLAAQGVLEFDVVASIDANQTQDVVNTATISTIDQIDIVATNNSSDATVDFLSTDLSIVKTASPDPVNAGETLTYTLTVDNNGPDDATGVFVTDTLPANVTFVSGNVRLPGEDGTVDNSNLIGQDPDNPTDPQALRISIGNVANGEDAVVTLTVTVNQNSADLFSNEARVNVSPDTDSNEANDVSSVDTNVQRTVDLRVEKTTTGTAVAGDTLTYQIVVTNDGPSTARGVEVADLLPDGMVFAGNVQSAATITVTQDGGNDNDGDDMDNVTFTLPDLAPGATEAITFTFDVQLDSSLSGDITNTATVSTTDNDDDPTNDDDSVLVGVGRSFNLTVSKTVDQTTAVPGQEQELEYTITVTNEATSLSDAPDVLITDVIPADLTGLSFDAPGSSANGFDNGTLSVEYATIPVGESRTFTYRAAILPAATADIVNVASVASRTDAASETDTTDNDNDATTVLTPDFDIVVTKTLASGTSPFGPGQQVTYQVELENEGPSSATGITLSDPIPAGLTFVSGAIGTTQATLVGGVPTFANLNIASGQTLAATLVFTVDANTDGTVTNTASIPTDLVGENDTTNNSASVDITVEPLADLLVTKTVDNAQAIAGDALVYTITVTNDGPSTAQGVTVTDTLPAGVSFTSGSGPNGEVLTETNGVVTFNAGTLADQASITLVINGTVDAGATGSLTNNVRVDTTTNEVTENNNTALASTAIDPRNASIAGSVYIDANNNGTRDAGEEGIAGVELTLTGTDALGNAVGATATTDADGRYLFDSLPAGTYSVAETQPPGFTDGQETVGTGNTNAVASDNVFTQIGLGQSIQAEEFNFGELDEPLSKRRFLASS